MGRAVPRPPPGRRQRLQRNLRLFFRASDLLWINIAFIAAYYLRYVTGLGGDVAGENFVDFDTYLPLQAGLTVTLFTIYHLAGVYRNPARESLLMEGWNLALSTSFGITLMFAGVFLLRSFAYSRGLFLIAWVLIIALVVTSRVIARMGLVLLRRRGVGVARVLVVGGDPLAMTVMHVLATEPGLGYRLAGFIQDGGGDDLGRFRCLGSLGNLAELLGEGTIDEVIIALPSAAHQSVPDITEVCAGAGGSYKIVPDLYEMSLSLSKVDVEDLRGIPLVGMKNISIQGSDLLVKRAMDIVAGLLGLVVISPFWLAITLAIKIGSPGPVYFVQTRLGKDGKPFPARKFRSMYIDAEARLGHLRGQNEATGPIFKMRNDPRVTGVGRWLRRTSLDELPQLLNVITGEMSLVGPRPPLPAEVEQYADWHRKRLTVAPGMTGLWQVSGRSELPFDEMVLLDLYYIENWSLGMDLQILLRTLPAVVTGKGAF